MIDPPSPNADPIRTALEPRRMRILELIWDQERSVSDIADHLPVTIAAVSQHLAKLRDAGLVAVRRQGRQRFYRATREDMGATAVLLESFWNDRLSALDELAKRLEGSPAPAANPPLSPPPPPATRGTRP